VTPGDVTEKRFMVTWLREPYPRPLRPNLGGRSLDECDLDPRGRGPPCPGGGPIRLSSTSLNGASVNLARRCGLTTHGRIPDCWAGATLT